MTSRLTSYLSCSRLDFFICSVVHICRNRLFLSIFRIEVTGSGHSFLKRLVLRAFRGIAGRLLIFQVSSNFGDMGLDLDVFWCIVFNEIEEASPIIAHRSLVASRKRDAPFPCLRTKMNWQVSTDACTSFRRPKTFDGLRGIQKTGSLTKYDSLQPICAGLRPPHASSIRMAHFSSSLSSQEERRGALSGPSPPSTPYPTNQPRGRRA